MTAPTTFDTPTPITLDVDISCGDVHITAGDQTTTTVEIRPGNGAAASAKAAEETRVDLYDGRLVIQGPRQGGLSWLGLGRTAYVDIIVELPTGSDVNCDASVGAVRCEGALGDLRLKTAAGDIVVDKASTVDLSTASGRVHVGVVDGDAAIKTADGDASIGHVGGAARFRAARGDLTIDRADGDVDVKTADGDASIGRVRRGAVNLHTASGSFEVGISTGTAAWLDVSTWSGEVRNELSTTVGPEDADETVEIRARTYDGDVVIRRA